MGPPPSSLLPHQHLAPNPDHSPRPCVLFKLFLWWRYKNLHYIKAIIHIEYETNEPGYNGRQWLEDVKFLRVQEHMHNILSILYLIFLTVLTSMYISIIFTNNKISGVSTICVLYNIY